MIQSKVLVLKNAIELTNGLKFPSGHEFTIVQDVVYTDGSMYPPAMQQKLYEWITKNPLLFNDMTLNW